MSATILDRCKAEESEIPFPQLDVHLRYVDAVRG
jgi:small-conductance mechanosensitive channel